MSEVFQIQGDKLDELLAYDGPVVVDFTATWCGPCRLISPFIDQLAQDYEGRARIAKLDVDENRETAKRFEVRSIPAVLFFKNGVLADRVVGAVPYDKFTTALDQLLAVEV